MQIDTPEAVLTLAREFMASRIIISGAELNIFALLSEKPLTAAEIAQRINANLRALTTLLDALAALGLLLKKKGTYRCAPRFSSALSDTHPASFLPMLLHLATLWQRWSKLTDTVRGTQKPEKLSSLIINTDERKAFIGAMHALAVTRAKETVDTIKPGTAKKLLDVGGASGTYTMAFLQASPALKATLFDKKEVIELARERLGKNAMGKRVQLVAGDYYKDELPQGHDLAFLSAIIHQNSPAQNLELFRKVYRALEPGGRIVIRDHVMEPDRTKPISGAIFAINMLVATEGGGTYTLKEITADLSQAGFKKVRLLEKAEMNSLIEAFKP